MVAGLALIPALSLAATSAHAAQTDNTTQHVEVHYHDLDLATPKGRAQMETRLQRAAATVCGYSNDEHHLLGDDAGRACYDNALAHARTALAAAQKPGQMATR
jgi:UrcA family protein